MKRTKIVATISDKRCEIGFLRELYEAGMNVVRLNTAHQPLDEAMNGNGFQAVMAKASLKVRGILDSTEMRLPNVGPGEAELVRAEKGMRAAGLL